MRKFGLIGFPLKHSFSKRYFTEKFQREGWDDCQYELFDIDKIEKIHQVLTENPQLVGLNVTIPYKEQIIPFLNELEPSCQAIGAVNTIKIINGRLVGYNTDYIGFKQSLSHWLPSRPVNALVLGSGGASRAVKQALRDLNIPFLGVTRTKGDGRDQLDYLDLAENRQILQDYLLIINTTPLGTFPNTEEMPGIPMSFISDKHIVYDLVYNPEQTMLMKQVEEKGGKAKNGLEMLHLQAEASWEIWNRQL